MDLVKLDHRHHDQLLRLEGDMYWTEGDWKKLWDKEARQKFDDLITDYLTNFPQGCFGLVDRGELVGAIFLLKVSGLKPIPYVNKVADHLNETGDIAYVSFFVIKKGNKDEEIAQELYDKAQDVALLSIGCKKIAVVINNSPLEERILVGNNYERSVEEFQWEIYPGMMVPCHIYSYSLLMEEPK
jgi:hypothetical protein